MFLTILFNMILLVDFTLTWWWYVLPIAYYVGKKRDQKIRAYLYYISYIIIEVKGTFPIFVTRNILLLLLIKFLYTKNKSYL